MDRVEAGRVSEGPTPERIRRAGRLLEAIAPGGGVNYGAIRMLDGSILDLLASRGQITGDQYHAGVRFYADWYLSGLANSGVIDPGRVVVDGGTSAHESDRKLDALTRWKAAVQAIGIVHCKVMTDVVLNEMPLGDYGRKMGQAAPKLAKLVATSALRNALAELDYHYHGKRKTPTRANIEPGFRPVIPPRETGE